MSSDPKSPGDKPKSNWNEFVKGDEKQLGLSKDVLRKLRQMNPNLQDGSSTEDFLKNVRATVKSEPKPAAAASKPAAQTLVSAPNKPVTPAPAKALPKDLLDALFAQKQSLDEKSQALESELKRLQEEQKALQEEQKALRSQVCEAFIADCLAIDPGLTSPKSQYVLSQEKAFLDSIGFSVARLVEQQRKAKGG